MQQCFSQKSALIFDRMNRNAPAYPVSLCRCVQKRCNMCIFTVFYYNPICAKKCEFTARMGAHRERPHRRPLRTKIAHRQSRCLWTSQGDAIFAFARLGTNESGRERSARRADACRSRRTRIAHRQSAAFEQAEGTRLLPLHGAEVPCRRSGGAEGFGFCLRAGLWSG